MCSINIINNRIDGVKYVDVYNAIFYILKHATSPMAVTS